MYPFEYVAPSSIQEVLRAIADNEDYEVILWGGGTSNTLLLKQNLISPTKVVGLSRVPGLKGIDKTADGGVRIGACTSIREIEQSELLQRILPCLPETAGKIGNVRVRNAAMLGGHLVHSDPAQDLPPLLLALDAEVKLVSLSGERILPMKDFFVDTMETATRPDELLTEVTIPAAALERKTRYVKYVPRSQDDYGTVGVAVSLKLAADGKTCEEVRIGVGGAAATALRFPEVEEELTGQVLTPERCAAAAAKVGELVEPWDDARGTEAYKRAMSRVWTQRLLLALSGGSPAQAAV